MLATPAVPVTVILPFVTQCPPGPGITGPLPMAAGPSVFTRLADVPISQERLPHGEGPLGAVWWHIRTARGFVAAVWVDWDWDKVSDVAARLEKAIGLPRDSVRFGYSGEDLAHGVKVEFVVPPQNVDVDVHPSKVV
jgi:hypothetical protein